MKGIVTCHDGLADARVVGEQEAQAGQLEEVLGDGLKRALDRVELLRGWLVSTMDGRKNPADASSDPCGGILN